jgi:hypothetical protein
MSKSDPTTNTTPVSIGADPGIDTATIVANIQADAAAKIESGLYDDLDVARAERFNTHALGTGDQFLQFYLRCLRESTAIDINDFDITEKRRFSFFWVKLKRAIWSLLKFYTYRLWSQQNQVNGLLLSALEGVEEHYRDRIEKLEARIEELEKNRA